jgi:DNA polymerase-3 subunit delta'
MNNLSNYFERLIDNDKLAHSFLIGNTNYDEISEEIIKNINKYIFKKDISSLNNPDLYILRPLNGLISKDQIKNLLNEISTTSQFNSNKVYIIEYAEKLNDFSYNAILKTLEEPKNNIYAFLLTSNINAVKPTIASRCQKIFISSELAKSKFDKDIIDIGNRFIDHIENDKIDTIGTYYDIYNEISDRNILIDVLKYLLEVYFTSLNNIILKKERNIIVENNTIEQISNKVLVIDRTINNLNNYLSKNITIDRFVIEMWRC